MSRLDWKEGGRFSRVLEEQQISGALRGFQNAQIEDSITYYRNWPEHSQTHAVYDEPTGTGIAFHPPVDLPVLHATHNEGGNQDTETGFYFVDDLYATLSFSQFTRSGLLGADIRSQDYLKDRVEYDGKLFRVTQIHITGQISQTDFMVALEGAQMKSDEYILDPQFTDLEP